MPDPAPFAQGLPQPLSLGGITSSKPQGEQPCLAVLGSGGSHPHALRALGSKYCDLASPRRGRTSPRPDLGLIPLLFVFPSYFY